jgi:membrane-bound lytic murein transglycosylase D
MNQPSKEFPGRKFNRLHWIIVYSLSASLIFVIWLTKCNVRNEKENTTSIDWQKRIGLTLPHQLTFAGDSLPTQDSAFLVRLKKHFPTKNGAKKNIANLIARSKKWFPVMESILKSKGLPEDLKYIAVAESHLTQARSPRNAVGFWQFVSTTAQKYGLEISEDVDERLSVEKSTHAAANYLKDAYNRFKNWSIAAAGYNLGLNGIEMQLKKQNKKSYFELDLNPETETYVYKLIALKCLFEYPEMYGIETKQGPEQGPISFTAIKVSSNIAHLEKFCEEKKYDFEVFRAMNPWLISDKLSNPHQKTYEFLYPKPKDLNFYKSLIQKKDTAHQDSDSTNSTKS